MPDRDAMRETAASEVAESVKPTVPSAVRLAWLLLFRSIVVTVLLVSVVAVRLGTGESMLADTSLIVYAMCAASYVAILLGALGLRSFGEAGIALQAYAQLFWDSLFGTVLTLTAGGVESAFAFLYFLNVLSAAALLGRRAALVAAAVDVGLYAGIFALQLEGFLSLLGGEPAALRQLASPFLTHVLGVVLVAILAGYLTEQLRETSESLEETRAHLDQLEELYAAVLRSLPSGVLTIDDRGVIVLVNRAGAEILGETAESLTRRRVGEVLPELVLGHGEDAYHRFEIAFHPEGRSERVLGGGIARLTGLEPLAGLVVVFQDLTELRRLQRDIARADRLATLGRFAAGLAHEIRNPLAAMIGCLELLEADATLSGAAPDGARMLSIVHREAERLSQLVTSFLTYARPAPPTRQAVNLTQLVREVLSAAQQDRGAVAVEFVGPERALVAADPAQLRQVLWNLVGNALQAVSRKSGEEDPSVGGRVRVNLFEEPGAVRLVVEDDGPGVPDELRPRVFEPFFTTRPGGTGLGLATSYQIVYAHGGTLQVDGSPLGGASFEVRLPRSDARSERAPSAVPEPVLSLVGST